MKGNLNFRTTLRGNTGGVNGNIIVDTTGV